MSFGHPKCKAFSGFALWIVWAAMLAGAIFFLGFSLWKWVNL